jgi:hypothetical protein
VNGCPPHFSQGTTIMHDLLPFSHRPLHREPDDPSGQGSGGDPARPLDGTTLFVLGSDRRGAPPYRLWAVDLGGTGIFIDTAPGLTTRLERDTFGPAIIVIDDSDLSLDAAADIATEVRLLRPDVPVILAIDPDDADFDPDPDQPGFAVECRPITLASLAKAIDIARLVTRFDRSSQPYGLARRGTPPDLRGAVPHPTPRSPARAPLWRSSALFGLSLLLALLILWTLVPTIVAGLLPPGRN